MNKAKPKPKVEEPPAKPAASGPEANNSQGDGNTAPSDTAADKPTAMDLDWLLLLLLLVLVHVLIDWLIKAMVHNVTHC